MKMKTFFPWMLILGFAVLGGLIVFGLVVTWISVYSGS